MSNLGARINSSNDTAGKVMKGGLVAGGIYALKKLKDGVDGVSQTIQNSQAENMMQLNDSTSFPTGTIKVESSEIIDALFSLPIEEAQTFKERVEENSFVAFKSFAMYSNQSKLKY